MSEQSVHDFLHELAVADEIGCPVPQREQYATELSGILRLGRRRALVVRLADLPRPAWIALAAWPYPLGMALHPTGAADAHLYGGGQGLVCLMMLGLARLGWTVAEKHAPEVADILAASPDRDSFAGWLLRNQRLWPQSAAAVLGALVSLLAAYVSGGDSSSVPGPVLYPAALWTGLLGGNVLYWLFVAANTPIHIRYSRDLRLSLIDPACTPGIVALCKCYVLVSAGAALGLVVVELNALPLAPDDMDDTTPLTFLAAYVIPATAGFLSLHLGAQPFITLSRTVRHYQKQVAAPLIARIADPPAALVLHPGLQTTHDTYKLLRTQRTLPVKTWAVLQYVTGILATLIAYFLQQILR
ncbi:hypothetical protein [Actinocorallia longicatena]|uniref:Uncharacterized protein n=1 Tax=Actinocorallia longicatena TaxID=111803 RepID=A0ABP6Q0S7_9ACTN